MREQYIVNPKGKVYYRHGMKYVGEIRSAVKEGGRVVYTGIDNLQNTSLTEEELLKLLNEARVKQAEVDLLEKLV